MGLYETWRRALEMYLLLEYHVPTPLGSRDIPFLSNPAPISDPRCTVGHRRAGTYDRNSFSIGYRRAGTYGELPAVARAPFPLFFGLTDKAGEDVILF